MSSGPPPVPGGRTPEEREAARREREARRAARSDDGGRAVMTAPPPPPADGRADDWLAEAERLTADGGRGERRAGPRGPRWGRIVAAAIALAVLGVAAWVLISLFQPFKGESDGRARARQHPARARRSATSPTCSRQRGVISSAGFFELRARLAGRSGELKPGSYELREDMSFTAALDALEQGVPPNVTVVSDPRGPVAARDRADREGQPAARLLHAREPPQPGAQAAPLRRARRGQPRGLPVPGHLRAEEAAPRERAREPLSSRPSSATSTRSTCATRSART